jgi:hypothetical protein
VLLLKGRTLAEDQSPAAVQAAAVGCKFMPAI